MASCAKCCAPVGKLLALDCSRCEKTFHRKCTQGLDGKILSASTLKAFVQTKTKWWCAPCSLPNAPESSFELSVTEVCVLNDPLPSGSPQLDQLQRANQPTSKRSPNGLTHPPRNIVDSSRGIVSELGRLSLSDGSASDAQHPKESESSGRQEISKSQNPPTGESQPLAHSNAAPSVGVSAPEAKELPVPGQRKWSILVDGTIQGRPLLVSECGERFALNTHKSAASWQWGCTHRAGRNGAEPCKARVSQRVSFTEMPSEVFERKEMDLTAAERRIFNKTNIDAKLRLLVEPEQDDFLFRPHSSDSDHNHDLDIGTEIRAAIARDAKALSRQRPLEAVGSIVAQVRGNLERDGGNECCIAPSLLARQLQRDRAKRLPKLEV